MSRPPPQSVRSILRTLSESVTVPEFRFFATFSIFGLFSSREPAAGGQKRPKTAVSGCFRGQKQRTLYPVWLYGTFGAVARVWGAGSLILSTLAAARVVGAVRFAVSRVFSVAARGFSGGFGEKRPFRGCQKRPLLLVKRRFFDLLFFGATF